MTGSVHRIEARYERIHVSIAGTPRERWHEPYPCNELDALIATITYIHGMTWVTSISRGYGSKQIPKIKS